MKRIIVLLFLLLMPFVSAAPVAYITESATTDYYINGTIKDFSGIGYIEVDVGNTNDVLQFLRLNLSTTQGTNLLSEEAYRAVASSPNLGDRTRIYVSTSNSAEDVSYNTTNSSRVLASLKLDYGNLIGGRDISANDTNSFVFNLTLNFTTNVSNVNLTIQLAKDSYGAADSMNITGATATEGSVIVNDTDSDNYYDKISWNGDGAAVISFNASTKSNVNFNETDMYVSLDPLYGVLSFATANITGSGINFTNLFSRGPIREGVDLHDMGSGNWEVRGFLKNIAAGLNYSVDSWGLYEVSDLQNPALSSTTNYLLKPDDMIYTDLHQETAAKPYYASAFDWEIIWGSPVYQSSPISRMELPTLYALDIWVDKTVSILSNEWNERILRVTDLVRHLGNSNLGVNRVIINSTIPNQSSNNWQIEDVDVYYVNSSGAYDITSSANFTISNPTTSSDGFVLLNITNITSILGRTLSVNEDIRLNYTISSAVSSVDQNLTFYSNSTMFTESGTPVTKNSSDTINISGVQEPSEPEPELPSGGRGGGARRRIYIAEERADVSLIQANIAKVVIVDRIRDNGLMGAGDVNAFIYIPLAGSLDVSSISVEMYNNKLDIWEKVEDFLVEYKGRVNISGKEYVASQIKKKEGKWKLHNGDKIKIDYEVRLPYGTNYIITRVSGYDSYNGQTVFEDSHTPIRVDLFESIPLEVKESDFEQIDGEIGKAVGWVKTIEIYNPNNADLTRELITSIFSDVLNAYLVEDGVKKELGLRRSGDNLVAEWEEKIKALERKVYVLKVTTPPVIKVRRETNVLQSDDTTAVLMVNVTIENTALENYTDIHYPLPVDKDKIIKIKYDGEDVDYADGFNISLIKARDIKEVVIVYRENIPALVVSIEKYLYQCSDSEINFTTFIMPGEESINYHLEVEIITSNKDDIFVDIIPIGKMEAGRELKISKTLNVNFILTGEYTLVAKLRKDFSTLLTSKNMFNVEQEEIRYCAPPRRVWLILLILFLFIIISVVSIGKYWISKVKSE